MAAPRNAATARAQAWLRVGLGLVVLCACCCGSMAQLCGDGVLDPGEECDDGNRFQPDGCNSVCLLETCGDGKVSRPVGEQCDDGNTIDGDGCSSTCQHEEVVLDECLTEGHRCHANAECNDPEPTVASTGDYTCTCKLGFYGNGLTYCQGACPEAYKPTFSDDCPCVARFTAPPLPWARARDACRAQGPGVDLATSLSGLSYTAMTSLREPDKDTPTWIGLYDADAGPGRLWLFSDGSAPSTFQPWSTGTLLDEDCGAMFLGNYWWPQACGDAYDYMCCAAQVPMLCHISNECVHGTCRDTAGGKVCDCEGAWRGDVCDEARECGDGIVDGDLGEECDDGNASDGDGCSSVCRLEPVDECTINNGGCHVNADCSDTTADAPGGVACVCKPGFEGDGVDVCDGRCPSGYEPTGGPCRCVARFNSPPLSWYEARYDCGIRGAELASVHSAAEWAVIAGIHAASGYATTWLGLSDEAVEGSWVWPDGSPVGFTAWSASEPNNAGVGGEDCGSIGWGVSTWNDLSCTREHGYMCCVADVARVCGDGIVDGDLGEECDDGNPRDGDGCDHACVREPGDECAVDNGGCHAHAECSDPDFTVAGDRVCTCARGYDGDGVVECKGRCPDGYEATGGPCGCVTEVHTARVTWDQAKLECASRGAVMASVHTASEWAVVKALHASRGLWTTWLGMSDAVVEGSWAWTDGTAVSFSAWGPSEPNNAGADGEHCGSIGRAGTWNDLACSRKNAFMCCLPDVPRACGDGIVDGDLGEECDDGNASDGDGCSSVCRLEPVDECTINNGGCHVNAECSDTTTDARGDVVCVCKPGFEGDGVDVCDGRCPSGYEPTGGPCRCVARFNSPPLSWYEARYECGIRGAELASVHSAAEWAVIAGVHAASGYATTWLGLSDEAVEGSWVWPDGSPVSFTAWSASEPNNAGVGGEDCGSIGWGSVAWNDLSCTREHGYMCCVSDVARVCGDGIVDGDLGEECDDGNPRDGDGCSSVCLVEPVDECEHNRGGCHESALCIDPDHTVAGDRICKCRPGFYGDGITERCHGVCPPGYERVHNLPGSCQCGGVGHQRTPHQYASHIGCPSPHYSSEEQWNAVYAFAAAQRTPFHNKPVMPMWLGMNDVATEGEYRLWDGSPAGYIPWATPYAPDDARDCTVWQAATGPAVSSESCAGTARHFRLCCIEDVMDRCGVNPDVCAEDEECSLYLHDVQENLWWHQCIRVNVCGDGIAEGAEECDSDAPECDQSTCTWREWDECIGGRNDCHERATCVDPDPSGGSLGDYECTCKPGFTGDGKLCRGVCGTSPDGGGVSGFPQWISSGETKTASQPACECMTVHRSEGFYTWNNAYHRCMGYPGASMLIFHSQAQFDVFVGSLEFGNAMQPGFPVWIGATSLADPAGSTYLWSRGEPIAFSAWGPGQPNAADGRCSTVEQTAFGVPPVDARWWTKDCEYSFALQACCSDSVRDMCLVDKPCTTVTPLAKCYMYAWPEPYCVCPPEYKGLRCTVLRVCGDGVVDTEIGEQCDGGPDCGGNCRWDLCGNGIVDHEEECDGGPACDTDCTFLQVDECVTSRNDCHLNAVCFDPNHSYFSQNDHTCTCEPGYVGDGKLECVGACPAGFTPIGGACRCARAYAGPRSWAGARSACRAVGPGVDLAAVDSPAEWTRLTALGDGERWMWLALNDQASEGTFVNADGTGGSTPFLAWAPGNPSTPRALFPEEDCVASSGRRNPSAHSMYDMRCGAALGYYCCAGDYESPCSPDPCAHGECVAHDLGDFTCTCEEGWRGDLCDVERVCGDYVVDPGEECDNGGPGCSECRRVAICGNSVVEEGEQCDGQPGCGPDCVYLDLDECSRDELNTCHHNARCFDSNHNYFSRDDHTCACRPGFTGDGTTCVGACPLGYVPGPGACECLGTDASWQHTWQGAQEFCSATRVAGSTATLLAFHSAADVAHLIGGPFTPAPGPLSPARRVWTAMNKLGSPAWVNDDGSSVAYMHSWADANSDSAGAMPLPSFGEDCGELVVSSSLPERIAMGAAPCRAARQTACCVQQVADVCADGYCVNGVCSYDASANPVCDCTATLWRGPRCDEPRICGDGIVDADLDEECDGGTDCDAECQLFVCGNGIVEGSEECDGGPVCSDLCAVLVTCGDGVVDAGEQCDSTPDCNDRCSWLDVDECETDANVCHERALCVDDDHGRLATGGVTCTCKPGYTGDGITHCNGVCPAGFQQIPMPPASDLPCRCLQVFYTRHPFVTWHQARDKCVAMGLGFDLASIHSPAAAALLESLHNAAVFFPTLDRTWIGLNDQAVQGTWEWSDASPLGYQDWVNGEPGRTDTSSRCVTAQNLHGAFGWTKWDQCGSRSVHAYACCSGFMKDTCQSSGDPCRNGGTCSVSATGGAQCDCEGTAFRGRYCETPRRCGDGIVDADLGETCDDNRPQCYRCRLPECGNGRVEYGEECDPPAPGACSRACQVYVDPCLAELDTPVCQHGGRCSTSSSLEAVCDCSGTGYTGRRCGVDNGCGEGAATCHSRATCINRPGGEFECRCRRGYVGNGRVCFSFPFGSAPPSRSDSDSDGAGGEVWAPPHNVVGFEFVFPHTTTGLTVAAFHTRLVPADGNHVRPPAAVELRALGAASRHFRLDVVVGWPLQDLTVEVELVQGAQGVLPPPASSMLSYLYAPPTPLLTSSIGGSGGVASHHEFTLLAFYATPEVRGVSREAMAVTTSGWATVTFTGWGRRSPGVYYWNVALGSGAGTATFRLQDTTELSSRGASAVVPAHTASQPFTVDFLGRCTASECRGRAVGNTCKETSAGGTGMCFGFLQVAPDDGTAELVTVYPASCPRGTRPCDSVQVPTAAPARVPPCDACELGTAGPCRHAVDGTCVPWANVATRSCPPGTLACHVDPCAEVRCSHGGVCVPDPSNADGFHCECSGLASGDTCEVHPCGSCGGVTACQHTNDGSCSPFYDGTQVCPAGTRSCAEEPDIECECTGSTSGPCRNPGNGVCYSRGADGACPAGTAMCGLAALSDATLSSNVVLHVTAAGVDGAAAESFLTALPATVAALAGVPLGDVHVVRVASVVDPAAESVVVVGLSVVAADPTAVAIAVTAAHRSGALSASLGDGVVTTGVRGQINDGVAGEEAGAEGGGNGAQVEGEVGDKVEGEVGGDAGGASAGDGGPAAAPSTSHQAPADDSGAPLTGVALASGAVATVLVALGAAVYARRRRQRDEVVTINLPPSSDVDDDSESEQDQDQSTSPRSSAPRRSPRSAPKIRPQATPRSQSSRRLKPADAPAVHD